MATGTLQGGALRVGMMLRAVPNGPVMAEAIPIFAGAALVLLSLNRGAFIYMAGGIAAIFVGLVVPVVRHVDDATIAALLMIAIGLLVLAALALVARFKPWSRGTARWRRGSEHHASHSPRGPSRT